MNNDAWRCPNCNSMNDGYAHNCIYCNATPYIDEFKIEQDGGLTEPNSEYRLPTEARMSVQT